MHISTLLSTIFLSLASYAAAKDPRCPKALPTPEFVIHNRVQTYNYGVTVSGPRAKHVTKHVSRGKAAHFGIESVCLNDVCDIDQLTYYYQGQPGTQRVSYGAWINGGGKILWIKDHDAAVKAGYSIVTAAYSTYTCSLVLIPFLNHDTSNVFDCKGVLSLGAGKSMTGCKAVALTPGKANPNQSLG